MTTEAQVNTAANRYTGEIPKEGRKQLTDHKNFNVKQARSGNQCCSGKAVSIIYFECVFVVPGIQHAMRMIHIVICGLSGSAIFSHIISQMARLSNKKNRYCALN